MTRRRRTVFALVVLVVVSAVGVVWWVQRGPDAASVDRVADWPAAVNSGPAATRPERVVGRFDDMGRVSDGAFIRRQDGDLVASTIGGDPVWRYERENADIASFDVRGTHIAVRWDDNVVTGMDAAGGDPSWAVALPGESDTGDADYSVEVTPAGGAIVARLPAGNSGEPQTVTAIDPDGDEAWSTNLPEGCETGNRDVAVVASTVVVYANRCETGHGALLLGFDLETGRRGWQQDVASQYRGILPLDDQRLALRAGVGRGVPIVNASSGQIEQRVAPFDDPGVAVARSALDGLVAWRKVDAAPDETALSVWSVSDNREVWSRSGPGPGKSYSPPVATGDVVYYVEIDQRADRATLVTSALDGGRELARTRIPNPRTDRGEWTYTIDHVADGVVAVLRSVAFGPYQTFVFAGR